MANEMIKIGSYNQDFNKIIGTNMQSMDIYRSKGLPAHLIKRHHYVALKYIDYLPDIISNPDYIGVDPQEPDSIEFVKSYKDNIWVGIKIDKNEDCYYVSTMYDVTESKISRRLHSGRIKTVSMNSTDNKSETNDIDKQSNS